MLGTRIKKWSKRLLLAVLILGIVLAGVLYWLLGTASGLQFALTQAQALSNESLVIKHSQGTVLHGLQLDDVRYSDPESGLAVDVDQFQFTFDPAALLQRELHVRQLHVDGIHVALLSRDDEDESEETKPDSGEFSLRAPLGIRVDDIKVTDLTVTQDGDDLFAAHEFALLNGYWGADTIALEKLFLDAPDGRVDLGAQLAFAEDYHGESAGEFTWQVGDYAIDGTLNAHSDGKRASGDITLTQPLPTTLTFSVEQSAEWPWQITLSVPQSDISPLLPNDSDAAIQQAGAELAMTGTLNEATLVGDVFADDYHLHIDPLNLTYDADKQQVDLKQLQLSSRNFAGTIRASGMADLAAEPLAGELELDLDALEIPAELAGYDLVADGHVKAGGSAEAFELATTLDAGLAELPSHIRINLEGTQESMHISRFTIDQDEGHFAATGDVALTPHIGWDFVIDSDRFDPGKIWPGIDGSINAALKTRGELQADGVDAFADIDTLDVDMAGYQISGDGNIHITPDLVADGDLQLQIGGNSVTIEAAEGRENHIRARIDAPALGDLLPTAQGALKSDLTLTGLWPEFAIKGNIHASHLRYDEQRVQALNIDLDLPNISRPGGTVKLRGTQVLAGGMTLDTVQLDADGNEAKHNARLRVQGEPLSLNLALNGSMQGDLWQGQLSELTLTPAESIKLPPWNLKRATALAYNYTNGEAKLDDTCLAARQTELCINAQQNAAGQLDAAYTLQNLPIAMLLRAADTDLPLRTRGRLDGDGQFQLRDAGLSGQARIYSESGDVRYIDVSGDPLLHYKDFSITADLAPTRQQINLTAQLDDDGTLQSRVTLGQNQTLDGDIHLALNSLRAIELFTDQLADVTGRIRADFTLGGTTQTPRINGQAALENFSSEVPMAGLELREGRVSVRSAGNNEYLELDGGIQSGAGNLRISGQLGIAEASDTLIELTGQQFQAAHIPGADVVISPDFRILQSSKGTEVTGRLDLDKARIELEKLPGGQGEAAGVAADPDVVIIDEDGEAQEPAEALPFRVDIVANLGNATHLTGYGVDGRLRGELHITQASHSQPRGKGQIEINGSYKAYGQDLKIEKGRLLFASTPIDNPGLNIRAVRDLDPNATVNEHQEVGLMITGTAQRPSMTVFSNPVMEQSDALAYLITGRPLASATGGDGDAVNAAAQALGSLTGDMLAKGIGSKLGIDAGVSSSSALGTTAFTVGKYLSPRLYLSYGMGVFDPGQVVTLRYILSKRWNFEAEQATEFGRASFNYRIEK